MGLRHVFSAMTVAAALCGGMAQAQTLGASEATLRASYPEGRIVAEGSQRALELRNVTYAGLQWSSVHFILDASGRLARMAMTTRNADYDEVMRLAQVQMQAPEPSGFQATAEDGSADMQIRVCQSATGEVTLTYEPVAQAS